MEGLRTERDIWEEEEVVAAVWVSVCEEEELGGRELVFLEVGDVIRSEREVYSVWLEKP